MLTRIRLHYELLQLTADASSADVRAAYLRRSLATHPDKGGCEEQFRQVKEAYEVLSCEKRRREYDLQAGFSFSFRPTAAGSPDCPGSPFFSSAASSSSTFSFASDAPPRTAYFGGPTVAGKRPRPPSDDPRQRAPKRSTFSARSFAAAEAAERMSAAAAAAADADPKPAPAEQLWERERKTSAATAAAEATTSTDESKPAEESKAKPAAAEKPTFTFAWA